LKGFEKSFLFLESIPCDILLTAHPDVSGLWSRLERRNQGAKPDPMIDGGACKNLAQNSKEQLERRVHSEGSQ
jgi:metallo-beta-lactamase class B